MIRIQPCLLALLLLASCNRSDNQAIGAVTDQLKKTYEDAKKGVSSLTPEVQSMTSAEIDKLFAYEYAVIDVPLSSSRGEVEEKLLLMGRDRWEAFSTEPRSDGTRIYFKRRPASYLRYIPRLAP